MGGLQLGLKRRVARLGIDGLLLQDGQDSHGLLKEEDALLEIHAKVARLPLDALAHVLLLLQDKHVMVEELLQLFVDKVDHELLEGVELEDLKACNVEDANEADLKSGSEYCYYLK